MGKVVLRDVAQNAGVSLRTASRVLNDDPNVAEATRLRVQQVMRSLDYTPDLMARSLRAGTDATIGLVVEAVADPFFADLVEAVETWASRAGKSVLIGSTHQEPGRERELVQQMLQRRVAGLILAPTPGDHTWLRSAAQATPLVLVDRPADGLEADLVAIDDHAATARAVAHLIAHGHRRIAYIGDDPDVPTSRNRLAGFHDTMASAGLAVRPELVRTDCPDRQTAARATSDLLAAAHQPTAIFSAATRCSLGVVPALHALGRSDIAVIGFGDFAMADSLRPGITVLDHQGAAVGRTAMQRLTARLADPGMAVSAQHLPVALIERGSGEVPG